MFLNKFNMAKITSEQAISNVIFSSLGDIRSIKTLEQSIIRRTCSENQSSSPTHDEEDEDDFDNDPRYKQMMEAMLKADKKKLEALKIQGSHPDALQPIVLLMGNTSLIQENVLESIKKQIADDEHYGFDLEFREIDSSELNEEFVLSLPKPKGADGGLLVISDFSKFVDSYSPNDQIKLLCTIMRNHGSTPDGFGLVCTGWRIIFLENSEDENKWWPDSCVQYFGNKNCLYSYFVE